MRDLGKIGLWVAVGLLAFGASPSKAQQANQELCLPVGLSCAPVTATNPLPQYTGGMTAARVTADGQIKGSAGFIHTISIAPTTATPTAGLLTVYDNVAETGTVVFSEWVFATTPGHTITLDVPTTNGIYVGYDGSLANVSVTVSYK